MGAEGIGAGGDIPDVHNDSVESTPSSTQSGGIEVQHLSNGGKGGQEGNDSPSIISKQSEGLSSSTTSQHPTSGGLGWAVVQLTEIAESLTIADVERDLRRSLEKVWDNGQPQIYFPAVTVTGTFARDNPYANYVFVASAAPDNKLLRLEDSRLVESVLCIPGSAGRWRTVNRISDEALHNTSTVVEQDTIPVDSDVKIISGEWSGLEGKVHSAFGSQVKIMIQLRSRRRFLVLSREDIVQI